MSGILRSSKFSHQTTVLCYNKHRKLVKAMDDPKELWKEVEQLQEKLNDVVRKKGVNSPEATRAIQAFRNKMQEYSSAIKRDPSGAAMDFNS